MKRFALLITALAIVVIVFPDITIAQEAPVVMATMTDSQNTADTEEEPTVQLPSLGGFIDAGNGFRVFAHVDVPYFMPPFRVDSAKNGGKMKYVNYVLPSFVPGRRSDGNREPVGPRSYFASDFDRIKKPGEYVYKFRRVRTPDGVRDLTFHLRVDPFWPWSHSCLLPSGEVEITGTLQMLNRVPNSVFYRHAGQEKSTRLPVVEVREGWGEWNLIMDYVDYSYGTHGWVTVNGYTLQVGYPLDLRDCGDEEPPGKG